MSRTAPTAAICLAIAVLLAGLCPTASGAAEYPQIARIEFPDLGWVPRQLKAEPKYASQKVRYCIWVLGNGRKSVMTMAWDESGGTGSGYDTLYMDRNFNRDLTDRGERLFWKNAPKGEDRKGPHEQYLIRNVKEAGGQKVFHVELRGIYAADEIQYDSTYKVNGPDGGYSVGPLPGNHAIQWSNDLKTAPVYHFGGPAMPSVNGKWPGESLGTFEAGRTAAAGMVVAHLGSPPQCQLRFYGSKFPGTGEAVRDNRWGTGAYPLVFLRVRGNDGAVVEEIPFADDCPCAGGFQPTLAIPSRVPPGRHTVVARMLRVDHLGGPADFLFPVQVANPDYGKPMQDPAYLALKAGHAGSDVRFVTLRRCEGADEAAGSYPGEVVVPDAVHDATMEPNSRDWDPRPVNYGATRFMQVGQRPHHDADSRTLLKFDLSGFDAQAKILGAQLRLTVMSDPFISAAEGAKVEAYAVRRAWHELPGPAGAACWLGPNYQGGSGQRWASGGCDDPKADRLPAPAGAADVGGFPRKLDPSDKSGEAPRERLRLVNIDVTDLLARWRSGALPNHGVLLKIAGKGNLRLCASEFLDYPYRPALVVAYRGRQPSPTYRVRPGEDLEFALAEARRTGKPLAIKFYSPSCEVCKKADLTTFRDGKVEAVLARGYQFVSLNIDRRKEFAKSLGVEAVPTVVVLSPDGKTPLGRIGAEALTSPQTFREALAGLKPGAP